MVNDTISDMLTRIRNACMVKKSTVMIPFPEMNQKIFTNFRKRRFYSKCCF
jgi:small subunit ribosomal protein S8